MRQISGNLLFLVASIALTIGTQATWCDVVSLFGVEAHHHADGNSTVCVTSHDHCHHGDHDHEPNSHEQEHVPCDEDSAFDLPDALISKTETGSPAALSFTLPCWLDVQPEAPRALQITTVDYISERSDRPPPQNSSPPFTGRFLI